MQMETDERLLGRDNSESGPTWGLRSTAVTTLASSLHSNALTFLLQHVRRHGDDGLCALDGRVNLATSLTKRLALK